MYIFDYLVFDTHHFPHISEKLVLQWMGENILLIQQMQVNYNIQLALCPVFMF